MTYVFIAGRTLEQGRQEILGKHSDEYAAIVGTLQMNEDDLKEAGLTPGMRVRVRTEWGESTFVCAVGDLPRGIVFAPYGPPTTRMMGGETDGTGMPNQKGWDVEVEPAAG
jgi:formylmethanofuran dehydrogenase subunit D